MHLRTVRHLAAIAGGIAAFSPISSPSAQMASVSAAAVSSAAMDAADSAALARTLYRSAVERLTAGDSANALLKLRESALAWPQQPAYANALLTLASRTHDSAQVEFALKLGNTIGVSLSGSQSGPARALVRPQAKQALALQDSLRSPIERSRTMQTLADSLLFPEGITIDARSNTLYVSSIFRRNVFRISETGATTPLIAQNETGIGSILGIAVDTLRNVIWAATLPMPLMDRAADSANVRPALIAIRTADGHVVRHLKFPNEKTEVSPGDIVVGANGDVFVSDAAAGVLWQLRNNSDSLIAIRHKLFHSLQGIIPSIDGRTAWVADYSVGVLRVDLQSHDVTRVADAPGNTSVGIDGMVRFGDSFIAVQNSFAPYRVLQIKLDPTGSRIASQTVIDQSALATSPTGGTIVGNNFVYVANSLWEDVGANGVLSANARHPKPILLSLPLQHP